MTILASSQSVRELRLDIAGLRKASVVFMMVGLLVVPLSRDPLAVAVACMVPWLLIAIVDKPHMPSAIFFLLLWQWGQITARLLIALLDGEALGDSLYGTDLSRAYWYSLASLVTFAAAIRFALGGRRSPSQKDGEDHLSWRPSKLFWMYIFTVVLSRGFNSLTSFAPGLTQPLSALGQLKTIALFLLFLTVLSTGRGKPWALIAIFLEIIMGFSGLFAEFKEAFFILALAALSARVPLKITTLMIGTIAATMLLGLGLFWTAVKPDYRDLATGRMGIQVIVVPLGERTNWLVDRALAPGDIIWQDALNGLIRRIAYIDFFGAVIGVMDAMSDSESLERWRDALGHVFTPRFLFPSKAALNDTDVFQRYTFEGMSDEISSGTSISIGHTAENYIDFGFPGMLIPIFCMGLLLGGVTRYFMSRAVAWAVREGFAVGCIMTASAGLEMSLAKFLGGILTTFIGLAIFLKFLYPRIVHWFR